MEKEGEKEEKRKGDSKALGSTSYRLLVILLLLISL
jgi:hypothetical protein